jgi:hypothetical protein
MVGARAQFGAHGNYQAGCRFEHLSNADIKEPDPGRNSSQIYVQYIFQARVAQVPRRGAC